MAPPTPFEERQYFRQPWMMLLILGSSGVMVLTFGLGFWQQLVRGQPFGNNPLSDGALLAIGIATLAMALVLTLGLVFANLHVRVDGDGIHIRFPPLTLNRQRTIRFAELSSAEARTYRPIREYGGWGLRWSFRGGRAYNVSGDRGVQLILTDGKKLLIGSQRADQLARSIADYRAASGR